MRVCVEYLLGVCNSKSSVCIAAWTIVDKKTKRCPLTHKIVDMVKIDDESIK